MTSRYQLPVPGPLRRDDRAALHYQLEDQLRRLASERVSGESIPSERELCAMFRVSRTTVRVAIGRLVTEGVLQRSHGSGTFVAEPKVLQSLVGLRSFSAGVALPGAHTAAKLVERGLVPASSEVAADLDVPIGSHVIFLERVRFVDGRPLMLNRSFFRPDLQSLLTADVESQSVWALIEERHGVVVVRAEETIEITSLGPREAGLLGEVPGSPSFHLRLLTFDRDDRPIERVHSVYRAATRFHIELRTPERRGQSHDIGPDGGSVRLAAVLNEGGGASG